MIDATQAEAERITGPCSCHEAYTSRKLIDPRCAWHEYAEEIADALQQAQASGLREAWDKLREFQRLYGHLEMDYSHFKHWLWQQIEARAKG